jgi:hypothetical protein
MAQERHMHCALHIIGSMKDSWNMKRHYIEGAKYNVSAVPFGLIVAWLRIYHARRMQKSHSLSAEVCNTLGCPELVPGFAKIK